MKDITNQRFGRLIATTPIRRPGKPGIFWECTCDCGGVKVASGNNLRMNRTLSCGCFQKERARQYALVEVDEISVIRLYNEGKKCREIATLLAVGENVILRVLHENKIEMQSAGRKKNRQLRHHVFDSDQINEHSAYWIGFLLADGCVHKKEVIITLAKKDKVHLEKWRSFLNSDSGIMRVKQKKSGDCYTLRVASKQMVSSLHYLGILPCKTRIVSPPASLVGDRHFWRGVIDGDGSLTRSGKKGYLPCISLVGTKDTCQNFLHFCNGFCPSIRAKVHPSKSIFSIAFSGKNAKIMSEVLYGNSQVFLDRKKEKYEMWKWFY